MEVLGGGGVRSSPARALTEQPVGLDLLGARGTVTVKPPEGAVHALEVRSPSTSFSDTERVGFYTFTQGERSFTVGVNLLDRRESDLAPPRSPERIPPPAGPGTAGGGGGLAARELWGGLVGVALLLLVLEWHLWCRGA